MSQEQLAEKVECNKCTISRMFCYTNSRKNGPFVVTEDWVKRFSLALEVNEEEYHELHDLAFPADKLFFESLNAHETLIQHNEKLIGNGFPPLVKEYK